MTTSLANICTFIIPVRIDCEERMINLRTVVDWLSPFGSSILILEADKKQKISSETFCNELVNICFIKDDKDIYHRTHYINVLLEMASTPFVAVWDTDIIIDRQQIVHAVQSFLIEKEYTLVCPYNKECVYLDKQLSNKFITSNDINYLHQRRMKSFIGRPICGGAYIVNKSFYNSIGGENESFIGWGPEDAERIRRVKIMGHKMGWVEGSSAYHLYHPQNRNSRFFDKETALSVRREFVKVCSMNKKELSEYIKTMSR